MKSEKRKKTVKIVTILLIGIVVYKALEHNQYVKLLDAIKDHDNQKVERILRWNYFDLDKQSGHFPWRWLSEFDDCNSPLEMACKSGNGAAVKMLIDKGAYAGIVHAGDFSPMYYTLLYTEEDDFEIIKLLVENGADPNGAPDDDHDGQSSLESCAGMRCYVDTREQNKGEDVESESINHYDPHTAKMILFIYQYLKKRIDKEYNPEYERWGYSPLSSAVNAQNLELITYLLKEGKYKVNDKDKEGQTCIYSLVTMMDELGEEELLEYDQEWKKETLELLMANGADLNVRDDLHRTPYDYAVVKRDMYLASLLKQCMEEKDIK